jgi:integrase
MAVKITRKSQPAAVASTPAPLDASQPPVSPILILTAEEVAARQSSSATKNRTADAVAKALGFPLGTPTLPARKVPFKPPETLADLVIAIKDDADLSKTQRGAAVSAIDRLCAFAGVAAGDVAAQAPAIRGLLKGLNPTYCSLIPEAFQNMVSLVGRSFRRYRRPKDLSHVKRNPLLPPEWSALLDSCADKKITIGLSRFSRFCAAQGWKPDDVGLEHLGLFVKMLDEDIMLSRRTASAEMAVTAWNRAVKLVPGWPQQRLTMATKTRRYTLEWQAFPESFRQDLDAYLLSRSEIDLTGQTAQRILRPRTILQIRDNVKQIASALVIKGIPIAEITDLSVLVRKEMANLAMTWFYQRAGKKITAQNHRLAGQLLSLAKQWCRPDQPTMEALQRLMIHLTYRQRGMSEKNHRRVVVFDDDRLKIRLFDLPAKLFDLAESRPHPIHAASLMRMAVCIEFLLNCPIRIGNLVSIDMEKHFVRSTPGSKGKVRYFVPGKEVKNKEPLDFEMPPELMQLINIYVNKYRSALTTKPTTLLFPATNGKPVTYVTLGRAISHITTKHVGVRINAHLFRHLASKFFLEANPGHYEELRRVMTHRSMSTTMRYTGSETAAAARHFQSTILGYRTGAARRAAAAKRKTTTSSSKRRKS